MSGYGSISSSSLSSRFSTATSVSLGIGVRYRGSPHIGHRILCRYRPVNATHVFLQQSTFLTEKSIILEIARTVSLKLGILMFDVASVTLLKAVYVSVGTFFCDFQATSLIAIRNLTVVDKSTAH